MAPRTRRSVSTPAWATRWFRGMAAIAVAGAIAAGLRLRVRSMAARRRDLETRVANRTKELTALNAIAVTVSQSLDLSAMLHEALAKTLQVMEIESGGIYLLDAKSGVL